MSRIILNSELLNRVFEGREVTRGEACQIYQDAENNPQELYTAAQFLRNKNKGGTVTYSRKIFFNLINLCRDTCSYCTYKAQPGESKVSMMSPDDVAKLAEVGKRYRCTEALFVTGERPEQKYQEARAWLARNGFSSTAEYLVHASEAALNAGLFPHTNAGNLTKSEMVQLKKTNVSLGVMLENASERLTGRGMPHEFAPSKNPRARIHVLENAGDLSIPMTTGLLLGIGETFSEIIDSLFAIKEIHQRHGNIQEVILQNFQPKPDTAMHDMPGAQEAYFKNMVALARVVMPEMNIQIPPNLSPGLYPDFLMAGINDWGGISPVTPDYVNPEFSWPSIETVQRNCRNSGFDLRARLPVYPEFFHMVEDNIMPKMLEVAGADGLVSEEFLR